MASKKIFKIFSLCWLLFLVSFSLGLYIYGAKVWPYPLIKEIERFISGHNMEQATLGEKILNDLNFKPSRHLVDFDPKTSVAGEHRELTGLPLNPRRKNPEIFLSDNAPKGFRVIYGVFDFLDTRCGAVLLDSKGNVAHVWQISQEDVEWEHRSDANVYPHGFAISRDGSILTGYDSGSSLTKYDFCGEIAWRLQGCYHHFVHLEDESFLWAWGPGGDNMMKIDYASGEISKKIAIRRVMLENLDIDIFGIRQKDGPKSSKMVKDGGGPFHGNDVEPLPKHLERYYPGFNAGDLLISLRSPNLIFVMDPDTLEVKWWRQGLTRRQHDPDWNDRGTITIFNNNMHRKYSNILELDPKTFESRVLVDGKKYNFYSAARGKHQFLPDGGILVTSSIQGRVFEVDKHGNIVFEFINRFSKGKNLLVSEALFLPEDFFKELPKCNP